MRRKFAAFKNKLITILPEGSFARNLAVTLSGNAGAILLGLAFTPFIARLYGPQAYGVFALFAALINNISPVVTWQYPTGYTTIRNHEEFIGVVQLTVMAVLAFSFLSGLGLFFYGTTLLHQLKLAELVAYRWLFPLYFLFIGFDQITRGWAIRLGAFNRMAAGRIGATLVSKGTTLVFGYAFYVNALGLMLGDLLQYPADTLARWSRTMRVECKELIKRWHITGKILRQYRAYPKYVTTGLLLSNFSNQLPVYVLSYSFNQSVVGLFAMANNLVTLPMNVLIMSATTVFLKKASELHHERPEALREAILRLYRQLTRIGMGALLALALLAQPVFLVLFGKAWSESGVYASLLAVSLVPAVAAQPLSTLFRVWNRERINFMINAIGIAVKVAALLGGAQLQSVRALLLLYALAVIAVNYGTLWTIFFISRLPKGEVIRDMVITLLLLTGVAIFCNFVF
ncbi:MAG: hypothetical protein KatS3mg032_1011 [Cyclobacteriaceae bacterium]|nr:MAG: hypothetical protein KatS3mg032_1011 [Cyclobacteriaceae bacterium]